MKKERDNYWKINVFEKLLNMEKKEKELKCTITLDYIKYLETKIKLMKEAQEYGRTKNKIK